MRCHFFYFSDQSFKSAGARGLNYYRVVFYGIRAEYVLEVGLLLEILFTLNRLHSLYLGLFLTVVLYNSLEFLYIILILG